MAEARFQKLVLEKLSSLESSVGVMKQEIDLIKGIVVDDLILSEEDRDDIKATLKEEKEGKLLSKQTVFG